MIPQKYFSVTTLSALLSATAVQAGVLEAWTFSEGDGTGINNTLSDLNTRFGPAASGNASVQAGALQFGYDGSTGSIFQGQGFAGSVGSLSSGVYDISWTFTSASFTSGTTLASVGFAFTDRVDTTGDLGQLELRYDAGTFGLRFDDAVVGAGTPIAGFSVSANTLAALAITVRIDLDNAGTAGSFQIGYQYDADPFIWAVTDGTAVAGLTLDGYEIQQQATIGERDWVAGDTVTIDNFTLSQVPEPSTYAAYAGVLALGVAALRRRR